MTLKILKTKDGSHTLYNQDLNEHYHSIHGAIAESKHIYIDNGLSQFNDEEINVLEIGMGTGLNTILSVREALKKKKKICYTTLEPYNIEYDLIKQLNYKELLSLNAFEQHVFDQIHLCKADKTHQFDDYFEFTKHHTPIQSYTSQKSFDLVFFDAFAPEKQADMWHVNVFEKLYNLLNNKGFITTYCCKGDVKRALKSVGFTINKKPGPENGKREMLTAYKI